MIRTQVRLDEREYALVKREAKEMGISAAEFVRRAVRDALGAGAEKPWMRYIGFVSSGDRRASLSVDEIVYGREH